MKSKLFLIVACLLFTASKCQKQTTDAPCVDPEMINPSAICTMEYDPVCGCDEKTYSNACQATNAGLTRWKTGECI